MINEKEAPEGYKPVMPINEPPCHNIDMGWFNKPEKPKDRTGLVQIGKDRKISGWKFTDGE